MNRIFVRPVFGFEKNYVISNTGDIYSLPRKGVWGLKKLKPSLNHNGYGKVTLLSGGKRHYFFIHRLVAYTFLENTENKRTINHIDGCKTNNNISNLEWATHSENRIHAIDNNLCVIARGSAMSKKLKECDVEKIFEMRKKGLYQREIALHFNVSESCIRDILSGRRWNHFTKLKPL